MTLMPETQGKPLPDSLEDIAGPTYGASAWEPVVQVDRQGASDDAEDSRFVIATAEDEDLLAAA